MCFCACVCGAVYVCVPVVFVHVHMKIKWSTSGVCCLSPPYSLTQDFLEPADWARLASQKALGSLCLCIPRSRIIGACQWLLMLLLLLVWVLGNSNADPHAHVTGTRETEPSLQLPRYLIKPNNSFFSVKRSVAKTGNWDNVKNFVAVSMIRKWSKKILVSKKHYEQYQAHLGQYMVIGITKEFLIYSQMKEKLNFLLYNVMIENWMMRTSYGNSEVLNLYTLLCHQSRPIFFHHPSQWWKWSL